MKNYHKKDKILKSKTNVQKFENIFCMNDRMS